MAFPLLNSSSFLGFVPSIVIQHLLDKSKNPDKSQGKFLLKLPEKQSLKSVVMFADISGFTNLTETLSKKGPEGAEIIAFAINRYMELMVKEIGRSGGDIFKFAGDAMIVVWPPPKQKNQLKNTCRQAVQAALSIQSKLDNMNITDGVKLSVKIGFGVGDFSIIYVGGIFERAEYLPAGDPLTQAFASEHAAECGGVINCSEQVYELIKDNFVAELKDSSHKIYQVKKVEKKVMVKADAMMIKDSLQSSDIEKIKSDVIQFFPRSLQSYIQYEQEQWSSELRMVTILFMNIGIDLSDCSDEDGLNKIQRIIQNIQKCVYMFEGSLNKFLMDDKGSTLIVVFGLPPITHQDDAVRAVLCAFQIRKQLKQDNCKCSIGIGTGLVFAGVVGTSGNRREYSVLGDSVNLSARIMQQACGEKDEKSKILCSETTALHSQNKISFLYKDSYYFKGKSKPIPVYAPLDMDDKQIQILDNKNIFPGLRTHLFSFPMDREKKEQKLEMFEYMKGYSQQLKDAEDFIKKFIQQQYLKACLIISGEIGVDRNKMKYKYDEKFHIIVSTIDPSSKFKKMNIMRTIIQKIIYIIELRPHDKEREDKEEKFTFNSFLNQPKFRDVNMKQHINTFKEICGIANKNYVESFPSFDNSPEKEQKEKLKEEANILSSLVLELFALYFEKALNKPQKNQSFSDSFFDQANYFSSNSSQSMRDSRCVVAPILLCFDDLQYADTYSFKAISDLIEKFEGILIVGGVRDTQLEKPTFRSSFLPSQEKIFSHGIQKIRNNLFEFQHSNINPDDTDLFLRIHLKGLKMDKMKEVIKKIFKLSKFQYIEKSTQKTINSQQEIPNSLEENHAAGNLSGLHYLEVAHITNSDLNSTEINKKKSVADEEMKQRLNEYEKEGKSYLFFSQIKSKLLKDPEHLFINFLYLKTQGNPLLANHLISNLISQKLLLILDVNVFLSVKEKNAEGVITQVEDELAKFYNIKEMLPEIGYITGHLKKAILLEDLNTIDVPYCRYNVNTPIIDKLGCLDQLVLKIASVIGEIFDLQTLLQVHPFGNAIKTERLIENLQLLEQQNFLEIVDQNENNIYYRFFSPFARETLYQRLIYQQRRQIHLVVAEALQNSLSLPHNFEDDIEKLKYQWLLGENSKDISIIELTHKAKRSIIVKRIHHQLTSNQNSSSIIIKQNYLEKKSDYSKFSWAKRYVVMNTKDIRYYYTIEDSKDKPEEYLGAIPLRSIYEVNMLDPLEYKRKDYPFRIQASTWYKKTKQQQKRDFYFSACSKEEYEEWYIYLNIAKTKAMQDEFHREYGKVNILKGNQEFDIQLKTFLEQKRIQAIQKSAETMKRRSTILPHSKSPITRSQKLKEEDHKNSQTKAINQQNLEIIQQQNLNTLKKNVRQFLKKGMTLLISHLLDIKTQKNQERIEFGNNEDIFKLTNTNLMPPPINDKLYLSQNSDNLLLSQDLSQSNNNQMMDSFLQNLSQSQIFDQEIFNRSASTSIQIPSNSSQIPSTSNQIPSKEIQKPKDLMGGLDFIKKRVTIMDDNNGDSFSPSSKLKGIAPKSILSHFKSNQEYNNSLENQQNIQVPKIIITKTEDVSIVDILKQDSKPKDNVLPENMNTYHSSKKDNPEQQSPNNEIFRSYDSPSFVNNKNLISHSEFNTPIINMPQISLIKIPLQYDNLPSFVDSIPPQNKLIDDQNKETSNLKSINENEITNTPEIDNKQSLEQGKENKKLVPNTSAVYGGNYNTSRGVITYSSAIGPLMKGGNFNQINNQEKGKQNNAYFSSSNNPFLSNQIAQFSMGGIRLDKQEKTLDTQFDSSYHSKFNNKEDLAFQSRVYEDGIVLKSKKMNDLFQRTNTFDTIQQQFSKIGFPSPFEHERTMERQSTLQTRSSISKDKSITNTQIELFPRESKLPSSLNSNQFYAEGKFKVKALLLAISFNGELKVEKDEIVDASLNKSQQEIIYIHKNNQYGVFNRSYFKFIHNRELNYPPTIYQLDNKQGEDINNNLFGRFTTSASSSTSNFKIHQQEIQHLEMDQHQDSQLF